jgi:hypothetical protein
MLDYLLEKFYVEKDVSSIFKAVLKNNSFPSANLMVRKLPFFQKISSYPGEGTAKNPLTAAVISHRHDIVDILLRRQGDDIDPQQAKDQACYGFALACYLITLADDDRPLINNEHFHALCAEHGIYHAVTITNKDGMKSDLVRIANHISSNFDIDPFLQISIGADRIPCPMEIALQPDCHREVAEIIMIQANQISKKGIENRFPSATPATPRRRPKSRG